MTNDGVYICIRSTSPFNIELTYSFMVNLHNEFFIGLYGLRGFNLEQGGNWEVGKVIYVIWFMCVWIMILVNVDMITHNIC